MWQRLAHEKEELGPRMRAEGMGFWKLVSRVFTENVASLGLLGALGFRQVGVYEKHAQLDGVWRDVVIVERMIPSNPEGV